MALAYSKGMAKGTQAPDFSLLGVDGQTWNLASFQDAKVLVVVFTCNHCPYAIACEDRLIAIQQDYADQGVQLVAISANNAEAYPDDSYEAMQQRARDKAFPFPYVYDAEQSVARAYDAMCTPDVFVFDAQRHLVYNGRIDDNWQNAEQVSRHDLREVLDSTLAGKGVAFDAVPSMGCSIKWK